MWPTIINKSNAGTHSFLVFPPPICLDSVPGDPVPRHLVRPRFAGSPLRGLTYLEGTPNGYGRAVETVDVMRLRDISISRK
jgi:hypothetical protein